MYGNRRRFGGRKIVNLILEKEKTGKGVSTFTCFFELKASAEPRLNSGHQQTKHVFDEM
jgi:hypothetical protein